MRSEILLNENWRFHKGDIQVSRPADKGPVYIQSKVERKKIGPAAYHYHDKPDEFSSSGEIKSEGWAFCQLPHDYIIDQDKEMLTPKAIIGMITAFAGLLIINLL